MIDMKSFILLCLLFGVFGSNAQKWEQFNYPKVSLVIEAEGHEGITKYQELVKEQGYEGIEDWVQHCCLVVANELYYTQEEANAMDVQEIVYKLNDGGALSYKDGASPTIEIGFDLNHLIKFINEYGKDAARDEIYGVLCHEIAHGYQQVPQSAGGYQVGTEFFGFIEGTADLVRLNTGGFNPPRFPKPGGEYNSGYNITAFFYLWISKTFGDTFLKDLNKTAATYEKWSFDKAVRELFGVPAEVLWLQYQQDLNAYPWDNNKDKVMACFSYNKTTILEGERILYTNASMNASSYEWSFEGGEPNLSNENQVAVTYPKKGWYPVRLLVNGDKTSDSYRADDLIHVIGSGDEFCVTQLGAKVTTQHNDSPKGEGPENLIDGNQKSKFLSFQGSAWVQVELHNPVIVNRYELTSANDQPARDPKNWILKGSKDGVHFSKIDVRRYEDFKERGQVKAYTVNPVKAFKYYRLEMENNHTDDFGNDILQLAEWSLFGVIENE